MRNAGLLALTALVAASCSVDECRAPAVRCGEVCVDLASDVQHCGACGRLCGPTERCSSGACTPLCPAPRVTCMDGERLFCADVASDPRHCGACHQACPEGGLCVGGTCKSACEVPLSLCAEGEHAMCVDLQRDPDHCGACATRCRPDEVCSEGACAAACVEPSPSFCSGACFDLRSDALNCGACGNACEAGETCSGGRCTTECALAGGAICAGACVQLESDPDHCGVCGVKCPSGTSCIRARCAAPVCTANPGFPSAPTLLSTVQPNGLLASDLDSDGHVDLVVTTVESNLFTDEEHLRFAIYRGVEGGTFTGPDLYTNSSRALAAADATGDGLPDLLVASDDGVRWLRNAGPAGFLGDRWITTARARRGQLASLESSGAQDVLLFDGSGARIVFASGKAPWTWRSPDTLRDARAADLDRDGLSDLVLAPQTKTTVLVSRNQGAGTFEAPRSYESGVFASEVELEDLDADGDLDLAMYGTDRTDRYLLVLFHNDGAGALTRTATIPLLPQAEYGGRHDLAVADVDADRAPDVLIGTREGIELYRNRGDGTLEAARRIPAASALALAVWDLDRDGRAEVLAGSVFATGIQVLRGLGTEDTPRTRPLPVKACRIAVADLDADGWLDVVASGEAQEAVTTLRGGPAGLEEPRAWPSRNVSSIRAADADGDGDLDLVLGKKWTSDAPVGLLLNRGDGSFAPEIGLTPSTPEAVWDLAVGDVTGDGAPDLLLEYLNANRIEVLAGTESAGFRASTSLSTGPAERLLGLGDVDGDGLRDVAVGYANSQAGVGVRVWRSRGQGRFEVPVQFASTPLLGYPYLVAGAFEDLDGDGRSDAVLLAADGYSDVGALLTFRNSGGTLVPWLQYRVVGRGTALALGSVGGSGRRDVAILDSAGNALALLPARADASLASFRRWGLSGGSYRSLVLADLDRDGRDDAVMGSESSMLILPGACSP